jgi:hypothetical protein
MLKHVRFTKRQLSLAKRAREAAEGREALFHGTRHPKLILRTDVLLPSELGVAVSFTRSPEVAAYFALLHGDDDEELGAVLVFDCQSLRYRHRVEPHHDPIWDNKKCRRDESEELIWGHPIMDVDRHLITCVMQPAGKARPETMKHRHEFERDVEARIRVLFWTSPARTGTLWRNVMPT